MNVITKTDKTRRRVAAIGMWDGLHRGHRFLIDFLLREAGARSLTPAVITFSDHPKRLVAPDEAPALLSTLDDRVNSLADAGIDDVILLTFTDSLRHMNARKFLEKLKKNYAIDTLIVGFNNRFGHNRADGLNEYRQVGDEIGLEILAAPEFKDPDSETVSSSTVRRLLADGNVEKAADLLTRPYMLRGIVVEGKRLGRSIGYPTANLKPCSPNSLIPGNGVYAAFVTTPDGMRRPAVVNIGVRPTVDNPDSADSEPLRSVEAHIPAFNGYLYDDEITVEFVHRIRDERKFKNLDKLKAAIAGDIRIALNRLK